MLRDLVAISQKFCCREEACGYVKVIHKKEKEKALKKMDKCSRYLKQWILICPPKKEKNKIAHVFLQSCFQVLKDRYVFKEHGRIRLATIYISTPYTPIHMHILI
jgi:hypothetical protein